jgi:hypothetical protein
MLAIEEEFQMARLVKATAGILLALSIGSGLTATPAFPAVASASPVTPSSSSSSSPLAGAAANSKGLVNPTGSDDDGGPDTENESAESSADLYTSGD